MNIQRTHRSQVRRPALQGRTPGPVGDFFSRTNPNNRDLGDLSVGIMVGGVGAVAGAAAGSVAGILLGDASGSPITGMVAGIAVGGFGGAVTGWLLTTPES